MNDLIKTEDMTPEQLGGEIRLLTRQARQMVLEYGIQIGYRLQLAKDKVGEDFAGWVERETEISKSSAYRFIKLYNEYGSAQGSLLGVENIFPTLGKISVSNALRLLAVPEEEREDFAREVDAEHISARDLEEEIRPTGLRLGLDFLMQKKTGEIVGVTQRGASLGVRRYSITPNGIVRQEDGDTGERLYRRGYRPREDTDSEATLKKWRHLEAMSWCDWDAPEE